VCAEQQYACVLCALCCVLCFEVPHNCCPCTNSAVLLLLLLLLTHQVDPRHGTMRGVRSRLPAAACRQQVLDAVGASDVVVISGATGCGKSTQVGACMHVPSVAAGLPT
jgi:hypothetical protein